MAVEVKYPCGCSYYHWGGDGVMINEACDKHRKEIINDRLKELFTK